MSNNKTTQRGFTLIELLVVMAIIGILTGLLMPAVQAAREASRVSSCSNNMRQLCLGVIQYEITNRAFPPSYCFKPGTPGGNWSVQARILPYLEQGNIYDKIDFKQHYDVVTLPDGRLLRTLSIDTYLCPSEVNVIVRPDANGVPQHFPLNYGMNMGPWLVYNPVGNQPGEGAFTPNLALGTGMFPDGLSNTICAAEVKTFTPYFRNAGTAGPIPPSSPAQICSFGGEAKIGHNLYQRTGHTEWVDGKVHQTGFTATFPPNTKVMCSGFDVDFNNMQEGKSVTVPTYAAVTARSFHPGSVNVVMLDGSVRRVFDNVKLDIWRALSTRAGGDLVDETVP